MSSTNRGCWVFICVFLNLLFTNVHGHSVTREFLEHKHMPVLYRALTDNYFNSSLILENISKYAKSYVSNTQNDQVQACADAIDDVFRGFLNEEFWAFSMLDASSKIPSGLLVGNIVELGAYDECIDIAVQDGNIQYTGQHCLLALQTSWNNTSTSQSQAVLGSGLTYKFSLCLPSSCSPNILSDSFESLTSDLNWAIHRVKNTSLQISLDVVECHTTTKPPWTTAEIVGACLTLLFLLPAVICTIIDLTLCQTNHPKVSEPAKSYVTAFSIVNNMKKLMDTSVNDDAIQVLHILKFLSIGWVAIGHRFEVSVNQGPLINLLKILDFIKYWSAMFLLNAPLSVDIFFVISGILNTYTYLNASRKSKGVGGHLFNYVHRYIRLTPAYAVMILVTGTWLYRVGDGPLWNQIVGSAKEDCVNFWWTDLIYINNYYNPNHNCMLQSWYLAADMQLYWLSPLVLYSLWRWPKVGLAKLAVLTILSILSPFLVAYYYHIRAPIPTTLNPQRIELELAVLYMPTHTKTVSYIMGIFGGYILHLVKKKKMTLKFNTVTNVTLWLIADVLMLVAMNGGHYLFLLDRPYNIWQSSLYIALYRFFWSIGIVWVIVAITTGYGGIIGKIFCWKAWMPLGRLTYCIYLTHAAVILYSVGSLREPQYFSYYTMLLKFGGEFLIAIVLAAVLSLTIESPMLALEKILRRPKKRTLEANGEINDELTS